MNIPPFNVTEPKVVDLDAVRKVRGAQPLISVARGSRSCFACSLRLDESSREVQCSVCGRRFDPFEAILYLSRNWRIYATNRDALKAEVARLREERERLRKDVQNLKAQAKRSRANVGAA